MGDNSVRLFYDEMTGRFDLFIFMYTPGGKSLLTKEGIWETVPEGTMIDREKFKLLSLDQYAAESLATELASKGIKPRQASFIEGKLEATETHLKDLRHILKLPSPKEI